MALRREVQGHSCFREACMLCLLFFVIGVIVGIVLTLVAMAEVLLP